MRFNCPAPADLVTIALGGAVREELVRHVEQCGACRQQLSALRETAAALHSGTTGSAATFTDCLDDEQVAAIAEQGHLAELEALGHLGGCARCRRRVAAVARLLADPAVGAELRQLEAAVDRPTRRRSTLGASMVAAVLAVAAVLVIVLLPPSSPTISPATEQLEGRLTRESAITTTVAPRIVGPPALIVDSDSLRWTSVPHADRYEIKLFDREATLVWNPWTTDTVLAIPEELSRAAAATYLWKVEARTGWDRWVSSEWADFTVAPTGRAH